MTSAAVRADDWGRADGRDAALCKGASPRGPHGHPLPWPTSTDSAMDASVDGSTVYAAESSDGGRWDDDASIATDDYGGGGGSNDSRLRAALNEAEAWQRHAERLAKQLTIERWARAGSMSNDERDAPPQDGGADAAGASDGAPPPPAGPPQNAAAALLQAELRDRGSAAPPAPEFAWPGKSSSQIAALRARGAAGGWLVSPIEVKMRELLGNGAFGATYRAQWHSADVAVKRVRIESDMELSSFLREVESLSNLRHPGIIPFLGAVIKDQNHCWLLSEFMPGGNLEAMLHGKGSSCLRLSEGLERAAEVASALAVLSSCEPAVVHRDVKPSNVLIDGAGRARLGDFGLARRAAPAGLQGAMTGETGTYLYMAPEVMRHEEYSTPVDVWSFGVMLSEIAAREKPYKATFMTPAQIALAVSGGKLRPSVPPHAPPQLAALVARCCEHDASRRPTIKQVALDLRGTIDLVKAKEAAGPKKSGNPLSSRSLKSLFSGKSNDWQI